MKRGAKMSLRLMFDHAGQEETAMTWSEVSDAKLRRSTRGQIRGQRAALGAHLQAMLEPVMTVLGLVFLELLLLDFASVDIAALTSRHIDRALEIIWLLFLADFLIRFGVAPIKRNFLRQNWLSAISPGLPFLRPVRALQAARALRSVSLVRFSGGMNGGFAWCAPSDGGATSPSRFRCTGLKKCLRLHFQRTTVGSFSLNPKWPTCSG